MCFLFAMLVLPYLAYVLIKLVSLKDIIVMAPTMVSHRELSHYPIHFNSKCLTEIYLHHGWPQFSLLGPPISPSHLGARPSAGDGLVTLVVERV